MKVFPFELTGQVCARCIMDASAEDIRFDERGYCNYCNEFLLVENSKGIPKEKLALATEQLVDAVRADGRGKDYDCIVGLSGGADSAYALYQAKQLGLRPLAVHLDNGWNSELAVSNIENLIRKLNVDLYTHVIDWEEFRDLQLSFIKANVIDIELLTDNAMLSLNYRMAKRYRLRYILAGSNSATEGMSMPSNWNRFKYDARNIVAIHKKFGEKSFKTFPIIGTVGFATHKLINQIKWISFLDYFDYQKNSCMEMLSEKVGFRPYPYKHYESVFTRFYQGYILPNKFGIDKRKLHLSNLVVSGQMTRADAIHMLRNQPYEEPRQLAEDKAFFLKKIGISEDEFDSYIAAPEISHNSYGNELRLWRAALAINHFFKK
jgi:N-acetyl sugar amidotransferase